MLRGTCAHCQAPPEYEMKEDIYEGNPIVELLHFGGPIIERDQHFRFGKSKATLLLACMDIVEELAATEGNERPRVTNRVFIDVVSGYRILATVETFFELSDGRIVNLPWVRLQSERYLDLHIGFGRRKAKAILALRRQLARWANYPLVDR
jgi:hypothetical protein